MMVIYFTYLIVVLHLSRVNHLYNGGQQYGGRKAGRTCSKPTTIRRLRADFPTYRQKEMQL